MGDADYRNCINNGLGWCDKNEPARNGQFSLTLDANGRFVEKSN